MDEAEQTPEERIVCTRCMTPNDPANTLCTRCGAPLGNFSSAAPWDFSYAHGPAYPEPVSPRKKPIILIGAWLYFGPTAIGAAVFIVEFVEDFLLSDSFSVSHSPGLFVLVALLAAYFVLCLWVLFTVTRRFLKG